MRSCCLSLAAICTALCLTAPPLRAQAPANAPAPQDPAAKPAPPPTPRVEASRALAKALELIQTKNYPEAQKEIATAETLDPRHQYLWAAKGSLAQAQGHDPEALDDFQHELAAFPANLLTLDDIAFAQWRLGKRDEAIATLQRWIAADPHTFIAPTHLINFFHEIHRDDLAAGVGDRATLALGDEGAHNRQFLLSYGRAQAAAGQTDHAAATFERILDVTTDPIYTNDAAFFLAEQGRSLPHAEAAQRKAIAQLTHPSAAQHTVLPSALRTRLLVAAWDTLGWILYREGNLTAAEPYLRAAWRNRPDPAVGKHLGDLLLAQKNSAAALDTYELALASAPKPDPATAATPSPDITALQAAIAKLKQSGATSSIKDPAAAAAQLNTLDLGPAGFMQGQDNYTVILARGRISAESLQPHETLHGGSRRIENLELPPDFLPEDTAWLTRVATLTCKITCTLNFLP